MCFEVVLAAVHQEPTALRFARPPAASDRRVVRALMERLAPVS